MVAVEISLFANQKPLYDVGRLCHPATEVEVHEQTNLTLEIQSATEEERCQLVNTCLETRVFEDL